MGFSHSNRTVSKFMDNLILVYSIFADSPKRNLFEKLINFYKNKRLTIVLHWKFCRHITSILKTVNGKSIMVCQPLQVKKTFC